MERGRGVRGSGGERGGGMTNFKCRMTNGGPAWRFEAGFQPSGDGGCEIHDAFPTLMSIATHPAVPRFFWQQVFVWLIWSGEAQPGLIGIKNENAILIKRDFLGLPGGFVALVGAQPGSTRPATATARLARWARRWRCRRGDQVAAAFAEDSSQYFGDGEPGRREASETDWPKGQARKGRLSGSEGVNTNWQCGMRWQTRVVIHQNSFPQM